MEVTYYVRRADLWRGTVYACVKNPQWFNILRGWLFVVLFSTAFPLIRDDRAGVVWFTLSVCFFTLFGGIVLGGVTAAKNIYKKLPSKDTVRIYTDRISPQGFERHTLEGNISVAWQDMEKIADTTTDIYLFNNQGQNFYIPKCAFGGAEQAGAFFQAVQTYYDHPHPTHTM